MISGGWGEVRSRLRSVEIYHPGDKSRGCRIANMPTSRSATVTKEFLVCGGYGDHHRDCIIFNNGVWENAHTLNQMRMGYDFQYWFKYFYCWQSRQSTQPGHVCCRSSKWDSSKGLVIMGGSGASTTTEILRDNSTSDPYFDITATRK